MAQEKIRGIVIDVVKHSDRFNIVTLYTREREGVVSQSGGSGKSGVMLRARLQPSAIVRGDVRFKENRDIQMLGKVELECIRHDLYSHPVKSAIVMFAVEFLNTFLRQSAPDESLWDYIYCSLRRLDRERGSIANWHIAFRVGLLPHAGIQPDLRLHGRCGRLWFDMREGALTYSVPLHKDMLDDRETSVLPVIMRMNQDNCGKFRFVKEERRRILRKMLHYYAVHYPGIENMKSPAILQETFS